MKIILSRKGFDSAHGGIASPVFPTGKMLSFPIPGTDNKKDSIKYSDLWFDGMDLAQILCDLGYKEEKYSQYCHLDPDLVESRRKDNVENWTAAFGQINQSAKYLRNQQVGEGKNGEEGDLFFFFGNFHHVEKKNGKISYIRRSKNTTGDFRGSTFQAIWGYMQVGKVVTEPSEIMKYEWHPHACLPRNDKSGGDKNNTLYLPTKTLSFCPELPGWGVFDYDEKRVLTQKGCTKAVWKFSDALVVEKRKNRAKDNGGIYYPGIWQELVLDNPNATEWAKSIF
jgi:hypothetical protein